MSWTGSVSSATSPPCSDAHYFPLGLTESQVLKELAEEEEGRLANGGVAVHETGPSAFLALGLELEESQRQLRELVGQRRRSGVSSTVSEQRNVLQTAVSSWEVLRALYMPGLLQLQTDLEARARLNPEGNEVSTHPENVPLWLPSSIPSSRRNDVCAPALPLMEQRLRTAQCHDALDGLRHVLRIKTRMVLFKNKNIRGQRDGLRSRAVIDRVHARARGFAQKYRLSRDARLKLSGSGEWESVLQVLRDGDIRSYTDPNRLRKGPGRRGTREDEEGPEDEETGDAAARGDGISLLPEVRSVRDGTGETRRTLSWIWLMESRGVAEDAERNDDILRAEWAMSRARATRATEEVLLLREEMRRVLAFLDWKAQQWIEKREGREPHDDALAEGLAAYASEQAQLQRDLGMGFREEWKGSLEQADREEEEEEGVPDPDNNGPNDPDIDDDDDDEDDEGDEGEDDDAGRNRIHLPTADEAGGGVGAPGAPRE